MPCPCQSGGGGDGTGTLLTDQAAPAQTAAPTPAPVAPSSNAKLFLAGLALFFVVWLVMESSRGRKDA